VGALLAASTGIVGATVVAMGLISLPTMLRNGYCPRLASGAICASGTLGQVIPPSIVLVLLGDQLGNAFQQAQLKQGIFAPDTVSVSDLFAGALLPGLGLVMLYVLYALWVAWRHPERAPALQETQQRSARDLVRAIVPALALILMVLGSILTGVATATEAAAVGAVGATAFAALYGQLGWQRLGEVGRETVKITAMVFAILIGAALFSLVFRGYGGDDLVHEALSSLPGGTWGAVVAVMLLMFLLGFVLDFIEIVFVVVPIVGPVLLAMGVDPVWLGVMMAINLQTSFLTPPFGFALFYLRSVAPKSDYKDRVTGEIIPAVTTPQIYKGSIAYIVLQLIMVGATIAFPNLVIDGITQTQKVDADKVLQQMLEAAPEAEPSASEPEAGASSPAAEPGQESGEEKQAEEDDPMKALMESMKKDAAKK
jgi:tripartite ATP-independent transporter DctM subunit